MKDIVNNEEKKNFVNEAIDKAGYRNIDNLLEDLIFDKEVSCIVVIDQNSEELENVLSQLTINTDIIEFQTFKCGDKSIHKFVPFQQDIKVDSTEGSNISPDELDTIVVPAREEGFNEVFIEENCWHAIRMSSSMIDKIKYIAAYQTAPISAVTHYAEVSNIKKYKDTNKYILYFKEPAQELEETIELPEGNPNIAPQAHRYTTYERLMNANTLADLF